MKKGWKIFWIVCACVAGVGLVMAIAGAILGATFGTVQSAVWDYGNRAEQTVERLENSIEGYDDGEYDEYDEESYEDSMDEKLSGGSMLTNDVKVNIADVSELDIDVCYLQVEFQESTGEEIIFRTENIPDETAEELVMFRENRELEVGIRNEKTWKNVMKNRGEEGVLVIQIPKECQLNSITVSIGAGVLKADNIQTRELDVQVGAGIADIAKFNVNSIDIEVGAGEVNVAGTASAEVNIDCGIGKVDYQATGNEQDYSYDIECGAGIVRIGDKEYSGIMNGKKIINKGTMMEIDCGAGEVKIEFAEL